MISFKTILTGCAKAIVTISTLGVLVTACAPVQNQDAPALPAAASVAAPTANLTDGCIGAFDPAVDYFPEKVVITRSDAFSVAYFKHYKVVTVNAPAPGAKPIEYALVQCGAPAPTGFDAAQIIEVPVKTIVTMSTTYLPFLEQLGVLDRLVGVDDTTYISNPTVAQMAADGKLAIIGTGATVNVEKALDLQPDLIMTYASGAPDYDSHPKLLEAGLKVVLNGEWLDTSPLGRAEWGKYIALFVNKEATAEETFNKVAENYDRLAALAGSATQTPSVLMATDYQGTWYMPGGQSFVARYLKDAGATYPWADDASTGSLPLAFEEIYDKAKDADAWLNLGYVNSLEELKGMDARYADFAAFKSGAVWNNSKRMTANGGNDYYESGVARPDELLADMIAILHPDLLPDRELVYYVQLK